MDKPKPKPKLNPSFEKAVKLLADTPPISNKELVKRHKRSKNK